MSRKTGDVVKALKAKYPHHFVGQPAKPQFDPSHVVLNSTLAHDSKAEPPADVATIVGTHFVTGVLHVTKNGMTLHAGARIIPVNPNNVIFLEDIPTAEYIYLS